jgi:hypothetical protein
VTLLRSSLLIVAALLGGCAVDAAPSGLGAGGLKEDAGRAIPARMDGGSVSAESRYGHGTVSGPVRRSERGRAEVRLPGGTWIECGRSCSETLRRESIDFWESRDGRTGLSIDGPAYLRWGW